MVRAAWLLLAATMLIGLVAMHGLADGFASAAPSRTGIGAQMSGHPGGHDTARRHPVVIKRQVSKLGTQTLDHNAVLRGSWAASAVAITLVECGMDHSGCVAVLPTGHVFAPPAAISGPTPVSGSAAAAYRSYARRKSRGPPRVSLIGLGVSRT